MTDNKGQGAGGPDFAARVRASFARQTAMAELEAMTPKPSQYRRGEEIPEKALPYKLAKKYFFNDFGTYRELDRNGR